MKVAQEKKCIHKNFRFVFNEKAMYSKFLNTLPPPPQVYGLVKEKPKPKKKPIESFSEKKKSSSKLKKKFERKSYAF